MKLLNCKFWLPSGPAIALFVGVMGLNFGMAPVASATPAFSRTTGAECLKCHSASFPRLNWMGERFMRNGFALPGEGELDLGALPEEKQQVKEKKLKNLVIKDVGNILSVRGSFVAYDKKFQSVPEETTSVGSPSKFYLFVSTQIFDNVPIWAEGEVSTDTGELEVHNYFIGRTNIASSTLFNVRMGGFTPTEWTSLSNQKRSLDSATTHQGSYRGRNGFTQVSTGLGGKTGVEYYGYTDMFLWAVGYGDGQNFDLANPVIDDAKNQWVVGRFDFLKGSSVSLLYFNGGEFSAASGKDRIAYVLSGNYRLGSVLDLQAQYSMDNSSDYRARDDTTGYTVQADWTITDQWVGIVRYDTTDNGLTVRSTETQATVAVAWLPYQNVKLTVSYAAELDRAQFANDSATDRGEQKQDTYRLQLQFAL